MVNWSMRRARGCRMVFCAARCNRDSYVNMLIEAGKDRHQPIDGEAVQIGAPGAGENGGGKARDLSLPWGPLHRRPADADPCPPRTAC